MLDHICPLEALETESKDIDAFLNLTCSDDMNEVVERCNNLAVYISRTGKMLADAKFHKDQKLKSSVFQTLSGTAKMAGLSVTTINKLIDANCETENYMVNWIDRMNRTSTHQMEWCRTLISKAKEEMRLSPGISGRPSNQCSF